MNADGAFTFATSLESGASYSVSIHTQPSGPAQTCTVTGGTGTIASGNVVSVAVNCVTDSFTVAGVVSGLDGVGLVLQNNGGDDLAINANGTFAFATPLSDLSAYAVTVRTQPTSRSQTCTVSNDAGRLGGANVTNVVITCVTNRYTVGGTVTGLVGTGLVLRNNGGDLPVAANGTFTFPTSFDSGTSYAVTIQAQPNGPRQTCTVENGAAAVMSSNVTTVDVSCTTNTYTVGGTVNGLAGAGLVLRNNGGDDLPVSANGTFTFATAFADLSAFEVTVRTQPANLSQTCTVSNGSGNVVGANITAVAVTCVTNRYTVGGTVSGLAGTGLVLRNNAGDDLAIGANGTFTFATSLDSGTSYSVTIHSQPQTPRQTCTIMGGSGTVASGNVTSVSVNCTTDRFLIGGTVTGLAGTGLVLRNNGGDNLNINANGTFAFATPLADLSAYAVTVQTQPAGPSQTCTVSNGFGNVAGANVTNVAVNCVINTFTINGTVSGLGSGQSVVLQNNGGNNLTVSANGGFTFTAPVASGSAYAVTVLTSPATSTCTVTSGSGTVGASNVTSVVVSCVVNTYTVGGTVSGLGSGQSVVLQDNGGNDLTVSANGGFTFTAPIASGSTYNVTVATNPLGRACTVSNGSGTVTTSAITNVAVTCTPNSYAIGGIVNGLVAGQSVVLRNNGTNNLTVSANGGFTVATGLPGYHFHRDHRVPGTHPTGPSARGRGRSQGAPEAPSVASLPWTAPATSGTLSRAPTPRGGVHRRGTVHAPSAHVAPVGAGEELSWRHRVGPWYPVIPVELVPSLSGGDTSAGKTNEQGFGRPRRCLDVPRGELAARPTARPAAPRRLPAGPNTSACSRTTHIVHEAFDEFRSAVFLASDALRVTMRPARDGVLELAAAGTWPFADAELADHIASSVWLGEFADAGGDDRPSRYPRIQTAQTWAVECGRARTKLAVRFDDRVSRQN